MLGFLSYQMHTQKQLLLLQTLTSVVFVFHYLLIGATSGMAMNVINVFRNIVYYERNRRGSNDKILPIGFAVVLGTIGLLSWEAWYSIFVVLGLIINTLCMAFPDPQKVRKSILVTSPMVLIYDAFALSYGGIVYESVAIVSSLIGILRKRRSKSEDREAEV